MNDLAFGSGSCHALRLVRVFNSGTADTPLRGIRQKPIPNLAKRNKRREQPVIFVRRTGVSFNAMEDLVRKNCVKLALYHFERRDLSVVHPLEAAPGESNVTGPEEYLP